MSINSQTETVHTCKCIFWCVLSADCSIQLECAHVAGVLSYKNNDSSVTNTTGASGLYHMQDNIFASQLFGGHMDSNSYKYKSAEMWFNDQKKLNTCDNHLHLFSRHIYDFWGCFWLLHFYLSTTNIFSCPHWVLPGQMMGGRVFA